MVLFYLATIVVIVLKISEFTLLIWRPFYDETVLNIHLVGVVAALFVGIIHSYNLMKLISDLRTINAKCESDYESMRVGFCIRRVLMAFWFLISVGMIALLLMERQTRLLLINAIIFLLLAIQLLVLNIRLVRTMRLMFGESYAEANFKNERRFLMTTVVAFSVSYFFISAKSIIGYFFLSIHSQYNRAQYICRNNMHVDIFNVCCFLVIDFFPFIAIYCLHLANFKKEDQKNALLEEEEAEL